MNVSIVGTGNMARAIGTRLVAGANNVTLIGRTAEQAEKLAQDLRAAAKGGTTVKTAGSEAPIPDEIVVLAVWHPDALAFVEEAGDRLAGKVLVNIANPVNATYDDLATPPDSSSAEETARIAPPGARVVKAFNTTFAGVLLAGQVAGQQADVLIAADDAAARDAVSRMVESMGLRPVDVGPLRRARQLEGIGLLNIGLAVSRATNFVSMFKFLP